MICLRLETLLNCLTNLDVFLLNQIARANIIADFRDRLLIYVFIEIFENHRSLIDRKGEHNICLKPSRENIQHEVWKNLVVEGFAAACNAIGFIAVGKACVLKGIMIEYPGGISRVIQNGVES